MSRKDADQGQPTEEQSDSLLAAIDNLIIRGDAMARGDGSRATVEAWDDAVRQIRRVW